MGRNRFDKKVDANQPGIVGALRELGVSVELDKDDILCGWDKKTFWFEIKNPSTVSKRTNKILDSAKKPQQIILEKEWKGHYQIVSSLDEILLVLGLA
jgi:hypothetical protein